MLIKGFLKVIGYLFGTIVILGGTLLVGIYLGYENRPAIAKVTNVIGKEQPTDLEQVDFSPFWKAWDIINNKYVTVATSTATTTSPKIVTDEEKVYGAIAGLVESLGDPYSVFLPPIENKIFEDDISGNFGGVGVEIDLRDGVPTVVSPLEGSPAKKAGMLPGDRVIMVDDHSVVKIPLNETIRYIRGEVGTKVTLTVRREEVREPLKFTLTRDNIQVPTIKTAKREKEKTFIVHLYNFGATSPQLFRTALKEFAGTGWNRLVLDLRGNPGGYLEAAVDLASWFLPAGEIVVTEDHGPNDIHKEYKSRGYSGLNNKLKLVVLVDGGSASASEILAGAISENGKGTLVGQKTFGKGSVQELVSITKDTSIKITVARWLTPLGHSLSENGLVPEVVVELGKDDKEKGVDTQLEKAIEVLSKMK